MQGPRHLYGSYRPFTMESAIIRDYMGIGRAKLNDLLEVTGALTPEVFSHRVAALPQFLSLTCWAAAVVAFRRTGHVMVPRGS